MSEIKIILRSIKDFFSSKMLKIALIPLFLTMIILYVLFFILVNAGLESLNDFLFVTNQNQEAFKDDSFPFLFAWLSYVILFFSKYPIFISIASILFYIFGVFFVFQLSIIFTVIIIGFLTPMIIKNIHNKYYETLEYNGYATSLDSFFAIIKYLFIMILLFFLLIPIYFIPVLNVIALSFPFYYFFHKLLNFDVSSTILTKKQYHFIYFKEANKFRLRTLFLYLLSMIPFATLFFVVFFIIYLAHSYFIQLLEFENTKMLINKDLNNIE